MSKAHKCDRCGKLYEENQVPVELELMDVSCRKLDLCDKCYSKLCNFMANVQIETPAEGVERFRRSVLDIAKKNMLETEYRDVDRVMISAITGASYEEISDLELRATIYDEDVCYELINKKKGRKK